MNRFLEPSVSGDKDRFYTWSGLRDCKQLCMYVHRALSCHCRQHVWISTKNNSREKYIHIYSFQLKGIKMCSINSRAIVFPPGCPWIARKWAKEFLESSQYSNLVLLLPSWMSQSQSFSEKPCAPLCANAFSSTGLIVSQWIAASDGRSSWS